MVHSAEGENVVPFKTKDGTEGTNELIVRQFDEHEENSIRTLRNEANSTNATFARYVFQTLSICGIALGAILELMFFFPINPPGAGDHSASIALVKEIHAIQPIVGLAALPILAFALAVCRMGTYFYSDTNRQFGFELFLSRVRLTPPRMQGRWHESYRNVDWEEALRAWRVVQSTLFHEIHPREFILSRHRYAHRYEPSKANPMWFCQKSLFGTSSDVVWRSEKYLDTMQLLLLFVAFIGVVILWLVPLMASIKDTQLIFYVINHKEWIDHKEAYSRLVLFLIGLIVSFAVYLDYRIDEAPFGKRGGLFFSAVFLALIGLTFWGTRDNLPNLVNLVGIGGWNVSGVGFFLGFSAILIAAFSTLALWLSARNERARRQMLKDGIWSLHSCAIVWEAVVVAHFNAIERSHKMGIPSWKLADFSMKKPRGLLKFWGKVPSELWSQWQRGEAQFEEIANILKEPKDITPEVDGAGFTGYTFWLGQEAVSLARWADNVPGWTGLGEKELIRRYGTPKIRPRGKVFRLGPRMRPQNRQRKRTQLL